MIKFEFHDQPSREQTGEGPSGCRDTDQETAE